MGTSTGRPTAAGGINGPTSGGTVFKITPSGILTTLYTFCSQSGCTDGGGPAGVLVQATDGNFYGTTYGGRIDACGAGNSCGTVFKITPSGVLADAIVEGTRKEYLQSLATVPLLIIDDFGMRKLPLTPADDLLEIAMRRYERASTM